MYLRFGGATVLLHEVGKHGFILSNLYSKHRGKGQASKLMAMVCELADEQEREIVLWVGQFGDIHGLTNQDLEAWYGRLGFVEMQKVGGRTMMIRPPSQEKHGL
jgi:hypothetical protein